MIYAGLVRALLSRRIEIHYLSHITGHGLLKLMRPRADLGYEVHTLPPVPEVLRFLAERAEMSPAAAYSTFNMGVGYAVYCAAGSGEQVVSLCARLGLGAELAGVVTDGPRRVVLEPVDVVFESDDLDFTPRA
jgi:phosphoribosylformylglycinamidine cyclo-ligase